MGTSKSARILAPSFRFRSRICQSKCFRSNVFDKYFDHFPVAVHSFIQDHPHSTCPRDNLWFRKCIDQQIRHVRSCSRKSCTTRASCVRFFADIGFRSITTGQPFLSILSVAAFTPATTMLTALMGIPTP